MNCMKWIAWTGAATLAVGGVPSMASEVELKTAFSVEMSRYGETWKQEKFQVEVENVSANKQVYLHRELADGSWTSIPMAFERPVDGDTELWSLSVNAGDWGDEFVIKMTAEGREYWDNNYGANYRHLGSGHLLGKNRPLAVESYYETPDFKSSNNFLTTNIVLANIAHYKSVQVIYTKDNWATSQAVDAQYGGAVLNWGYGSYPNPSANNTELWKADFSIARSDRIEFYVKYSVDGVDYYDNNGGANYRFGYVKNYPYMNLRNSTYWNSPSGMRLVDDNLWSFTLTLQPGENRAIKFDVFGDWAVNFGDNNGDGYVEQNGANIPLPDGEGQFRITFNSVTGRYTVHRFGL